MIHTNNNILRHWLLYAAFVALGSVCFWVLVLVLRNALYELQGGFTADSPLYWAVGRGIVNGLVPYTDLFETKPPGIFLLSGLSFWLFGNVSLGYIVQSLAICAICAVSTWVSFCIAKRTDANHRFLYSCLGFLFGSLLALYTSWRSGLYQVESFGAAFGILYIGFVYGKKRLSVFECSAAAVLLVFSIGFKEPFVLVLAISMALLCSNWAQFVQVFLKPLGIAFLLGTIALYALGYLQPYVQVYLFGEMFSNLIHGADLEDVSSVWQRGLFFKNIWYDLQDFAPAFQYIIVLLVLGYAYFEVRIQRHWSQLLRAVVILSLAVYGTSFVVGLGVAYYNHHFSFAVPIYLSLFLCVLRDAHAWRSMWTHTFLVSSVTVLTIFSLYQVPQLSQNFAASLQEYSSDKQHVQSVAIQIDAILDSCGYDRYLFLGGNGTQPYGFTKHSPYGPLFFQMQHLLGKNRPEFRNQLKIALHQTSLVVFYRYEMDESLEEYIRTYLSDHFTKNPWDCVPSFQSSAEYSFYFRTQGL